MAMPTRALSSSPARPHCRWRRCPFPRRRQPQKNRASFRAMSSSPPSCPISVWRKALGAHGIPDVAPHPVGDKYVLEEMLKRGAAILWRTVRPRHLLKASHYRRRPPCSRICAFLKSFINPARRSDELVDEIKTFPQSSSTSASKAETPPRDLRTVPKTKSRPAEKAFAGSGRVVVRFSGTEPLAAS